MSLRVGIATRDITPPAGMPMGGYAARAGVAEGTLDRLCCRAVALSDGDTTLVLVALDLVYVASEWTTPLRLRIADRLRSNAANVLVAGTHTHSGPAVFHSTLVEHERLAAYEQQLGAIVVETVDDAHAQMHPVGLAVGSARVTGVGANRREAAGDVDDAVRVLVARSSAGRCAGVLAVFGCHPTVLSAANLRYSRDLFGAAVDAAEAALDAPVVLFNGAAADVSTRFVRREQSAAEVARLGRVLGDGIAAAAASAAAIATVPLRARVAVVPVAARRFPSAEDAQRLVAGAATQLQHTKDSGASAAEVRRVASRFEGAMAQLFLATHGGAVALIGRPPESALIQLLQIGGCDVLAVPGELFSSVGQQIRAARSRPAMLVGYANDYLGYFVPPSAAAGGGYEALMALIEPAAAAALADRVAQLG